MLMIRNVHISLLAVPAGREIPGARCLRRCSSNFDNSSIAFNPAGVAAQPDLDLGDHIGGNTFFGEVTDGKI